MKSKVEFTDEELAQIAELVRETSKFTVMTPIHTQTGCCRALSRR
jgi:hypothetical protein